jgi:endoglucanase
MSHVEELGHEVSGFLRAEGTKLINGEGREVLLRGVGFGSWTLPEGYMWLFPDQGDRPRRIERMVKELVGEAKAHLFWDQYYQCYVSEADIQCIAAEGYNSVRVPLNARFLIDERAEDGVHYIEEHLLMVDQVIQWCREHRLYVILDLHGAPGGQTGTNIDDSENDQPELFMNESNKQVTIALWRMLADRYKEEWIVAGYDLLNEPLPNWFSAYNEQIMPLYRDITQAIREVDDRHMIILEGAHWATDWSIFDEKFDDNLMLQFHKYWNNPDTESIQKYLDKRAEWNVPIYMGEGGENNTDWYAGAFRLFEDHDISWNFWTWKKMGKDNSPCKVIKPDGWDRLVDYLQGGSKPSEADAEKILWEYLHHLSFEQCEYQPEVTRSLFRRPTVRIPAIFYGYQGEGISYGVKNRVEHAMGFRVNDGTDIQFVDRTRTSPNFEHSKGEPWQENEMLFVRMSAGDWFEYAFTVGEHNHDARYAIELEVNTSDTWSEFTATIEGVMHERIQLEGGTWTTERLQSEFKLDKGMHNMVLKAIHGSVDMLWIKIIDTSKR